MKARIKNSADSIVLYIDGKVDYETQDDVCVFINKTIERNKKDETPKKIVVNFQNLEFVGSSGITQFVQSLKQIHNETDVTPKYCGVRSEFQKIMKAFDAENEFDFYDDEGLSRRNGKPLMNQ
jgi:anti-anti-sigma factor